MEQHHHLTCTKGLKKKIYRFLKFWFIFGHYVLICSYIVMYLESGQQKVRASLRNQTFDVLEQMVNSSLYNKIDLPLRKMKKKGLADLMDLKDKANKWDPEWNLVNSIYYCSSLYTTVGKKVKIGLLFWKKAFWVSSCFIQCMGILCMSLPLVAKNVRLQSEVCGFFFTRRTIVQ